MILNENNTMNTMLQILKKFSKSGTYWKREIDESFVNVDETIEIHKLSCRIKQ